MPIAAALNPLNSQIKNALNLGPAADPDLAATIMAAGVAQACVMGLLPSAPAPIPLTPAGLNAGMDLMKNAFSLGPAADPSIVSKLLGAGISLIAPLAPPAGLSFLQTQIENALSMGPAANIDTVALIIASAIIQYYTMGGII